MSLSDSGCCVRLVIPSQSEQQIAPVIGRIIGRWGGCTITSGAGWWTDADGTPVKDLVSVVECSIGDAWDQDTARWFHDLADVIRAEWSQDSVFLSVQGETAYLVTGRGPQGWEVIGRG